MPTFKMQNVKKKKIFDVLLLLTELILKALFNSIICGIMTDILSLQESDPIFLGVQYHCLNKCFLHQKYGIKGFLKEFAMQGSFVAI